MEDAMLVLSRKVGERIQIGDNITLVVSRVIGNRVTIGIEAPSDVRIVRSELAPREEASARPAARTSAPARLPVRPTKYESEYATT
jgi:carbon storage regulator